MMLLLLLLLYDSIACIAFRAPCKEKQLLKKNDEVKIKMDCIWGYKNCLARFSKFIFLTLQLWIVKLGSNLFAMHGVVICHLDWSNSFVNIIIKLQPSLSTTAILGTKESDGDREAAWPSGLRVGLAIWQSCVRVPLWPLAGFVLGRPEFKSLATLVNSQLVASCQLGF